MNKRPVVLDEGALIAHVEANGSPITTNGLPDQLDEQAITQRIVDKEAAKSLKLPPDVGSGVETNEYVRKQFCKMLELPESYSWEGIYDAVKVLKQIRNVQRKAKPRTVRPPIGQVENGCTPKG